MNPSPTGSEIPYEAVGVFEASDDESPVPTGYWIFDYVVRAEAEGGDASDFRVKGTVSAVCTNQDF